MMPSLRAHEHRETATRAGLLYVTDGIAGIRRERNGRGFIFYAPDGSRIDGDERKRFDALVIPPAWTDVWICPHPRGHIQATGRDARARKQYRYHPEWRQARDETKYHRMIAFGESLPSIRERFAADLSSPGLRRSKVLAAVLRLLDGTLIRVGNPEYA